MPRYFRKTKPGLASELLSGNMINDSEIYTVYTDGLIDLTNGYKTDLNWYTVETDTVTSNLTPNTAVLSTDYYTGSAV